MIEIVRSILFFYVQSDDTTLQEYSEYINPVLKLLEIPTMTKYFPQVLIVEE